jgi:hypothetical protein
VHHFSLPVVALIVACTVTACGGANGGTVPLAGPSATTPTVQAADQAAAVKTGLTAYLAAVTNLPNDVDDKTLSDVATPAWAATFASRYRKNIAARGLTFIGHNKLISADPQIAGDTATVDACVDGTGVFTVPKGETRAKSGDLPSPRARYTYRLKLQGGHWLVDSLATTGEPC